jgi:hypothetical protein
MADTLKYMGEIIAKKYGGPYIPSRLADLLKPTAKEDADVDMDGDAVALMVINKLKLRLKGGKVKNVNANNGPDSQT